MTFGWRNADFESTYKPELEGDLRTLLRRKLQISFKSHYHLENISLLAKTKEFLRVKINFILMKFM